MASEKLKSLIGQDTTIHSKGDAPAVTIDQLISANPQLEAIGFYFSAHWCGPCRAFTPKLAQFYNDINKDHKRFEIIFVSSDKTQGSFDQYYDTMPWLNIAWSNKQGTMKLKSTYNVQGIPSLVIVGLDGNTLTKSGRECVDGNPEGFPWPPKNFWQIASEGGDLKRNNGESVTVQSLKEKDVIGIYFSAHWCPPCRGFTPTLVSSYENLKSQGKSFEIIFASADHDQKSFEEYFATMPWVSFPLKDHRVTELNVKFEVSGIPRLILLDKEGNIINNNARSRVESDRNGAEFPWYPPVVEDLNTVSGNVINDEKCFIIADPGLSDEQMGLIRTVALEYNNRWKSQGLDSKPFNFVFAKDGPILNRLKQFLNITQPYPIFLLLDIPSQSKFIVGKQVSEENIKEFAEDIIASRIVTVGLKD